MMINFRAIVPENNKSKTLLKVAPLRTKKQTLKITCKDYSFLDEDHDKINVLKHSITSVVATKVVMLIDRIIVLVIIHILSTNYVYTFILDIQIFYKFYL